MCVSVCVYTYNVLLVQHRPYSESLSIPTTPTPAALRGEGPRLPSQPTPLLHWGQLETMGKAERTLVTSEKLKITCIRSHQTIARRPDSALRLFLCSL